MQCPNCGAVNRESAKFCNLCGSKILVSQPIPQEPVTKSRLMRIVNELKWIIILYLLLSLCCGAGAFFLGYRTNWILWKLGLR